jgi:glycosyltransferase involved in cell wall biosynthesis
MNILFLRAGIFSNLNHFLYEAMCRSHNIVYNVDAGKVLKRKSLQLSSWYNIFHTIIYFKKYWRQCHSKNTFAFSRMTKYCNRFIRSRTDYEIIFQTQCKFSITENPYSRPYYIYTDLTQKLTDRIWHKWALKGSAKEITKWYRLETEAFRRAEKIFTFNDHVKASFVDEYHISPEKVLVVGSGINSDSCTEVDFEQKYYHGFTLFFLTTEFDRQGGTTVLRCFDLIKQTVPEIKLIIAGKCPKFLQKDIKVYENLTSAFIEDLFNKALIFLMPGMLGGLQSVLQAMSRKCVCIVGDNNLLLTHVIKDNETGFVIPTNDPNSLTEKIITLYKDESLMKKIATHAYNFVNDNFTWDKVVNKMTQHFNT